MLKHCVIVSWAAAAGLSFVAAGESSSIYDLAPEHTIFVVGVEHAEETLARFKRTSLWELWKSPPIRELYERFREETTEAIEDMLGELGLEEEDLVLPTGSLGLAVFATFDELTGRPTPGFLLVADYGTRADQAAALLDTLVQRGREEGELEFEEREVLGRTVLSFDFPAGSDADAADDDPFAPPGMDGGFGMMAGPAADLMGAPETLFIVRDGSLFGLSTDLPTLTGALEIRDGAAPAAFAERADLHGVMDQIGESDLSCAVLMRDLGPLVSSVDQMGIMIMVVPMLKQLIGDVEGFGFGYRFDGETAMVEGVAGVYMPHGKQGVTALMNDAGAAGVVPAFVDPGTLSVSAVNFDFSRLPLALMPLTQWVQMMIPPGPVDKPGFAEILAQVCACLGRRIYTLQPDERPVTAGSMTNLVAVECPKPREFEQVLALMGPQLHGRDFLGHRIFELELPQMFPVANLQPAPPAAPAFGLGGGHLFVGPVASVERLLRAIGDVGNPTLAGDASFRRAIATLGTEPVVGWGYTDTVESIEAARRAAELQLEQVREQLQWMDEEDAQLGTFQRILGWFEDIDAEFLTEYLGPSAWKLVATEDGFVFTSYLLDGGG